jgi:hypothetical protein
LIRLAAKSRITPTGAFARSQFHQLSLNRNRSDGIGNSFRVKLRHVDEREVVKARVRGIQETKPVLARLDIEIRPVDQNGVSKNS